MPDQLIRNIPDDLLLWIEQERRDQGKSKQEFCLRMLERAREIGDRDRLPLFKTLPPPEADETDGLGFKFIDLFAGIGGMRQALDRIGGICKYSVEWDKYSQKTYREWYGETPKGDITKIDPADIPDHDILAAGFPCQPFSIAGVSKKKSLGHAHGFDCVNQGNLFFTLATIIEEKRPPIVLLENVKNLKSHDGGNTWKVIESKLKSLEYDVHAKIIDAAGWVPQHRERIYIVCFDQRLFGPTVNFDYPDPPEGPKPKLRDILDPNPDARYTLTDHLWKYLQAYAKKHQEKGNGFGYGLANLDGVTRTLSARYFKDGSEILIPQGEGKNPRRLTPRECQSLMGFDDLKIVVSDTQAYKQFGNAVVPKVAEAVAREILKVIQKHLTNTKNECLLKRSSNGPSRQDGQRITLRDDDPLRVVLQRSPEGFSEAEAEQVSVGGAAVQEAPGGVAVNLSKIQWTDATWNPVRGCSRVSRGCEHCYAEQIAGRFSGEGMPYRGFAETNSYHSQTGRPTTGSRGRWTGKVELIESKLEEPLHWREPRRVFVNSMSDLFHESLSQKDVADVFDVMAKASQHTFQVLTKRPKRMLQFCDGMRRLFERFDREDSSAAVKMRTVYPLPNVWLGVSVEDQATADERIPLLLRTPAAVHFVSYEPALDAVDFVGYLPAVVGRDLSEGQRAFQEELRAEVKRHGWSSIGWLIVGGESGPGARRFDLAWARSAISQCRAAGIPVFVKQIGSNPTTDHRTRPAGEDPFRLYRDGKGGNPSEWPEDLKVREFPS